MEKIIRLLDRSRTVKDWHCPRARYWAYEYMGKGIAPSAMSLPLSTGLIIHDAMAAIATLHKDNGTVDIDTIANLAFQQMYEALVPEDIQTTEQVTFGKEQASLTEGMIRGFYKHVWPRLMAEYPNIVAIEQEVEYPLEHPRTCHNCSGSGIQLQGDLGEVQCPACLGNGATGGYIFMAKPDLLLENEAGEMVYVEYKSTSSKQEKWINSWDTAVQLHSSIKAVEHTLGKAPDFVQIVGLYKGYESYGKQNSPLVYSYQKKGSPPFTQDQISYQYKAGFKRFPVWELEGGCKQWIEDMPAEILAEQFPMTLPIYVNDELVNSFFKQRLIREIDIRSALVYTENGVEVKDLDRVFPQKFESCQPPFGYGCEFKRLCHSHVEDPLKAGFSFREPHHAREQEVFDAANGLPEKVL